MQLYSVLQFAECLSIHCPSVGLECSSSNFVQVEAALKDITTFPN